MNRNWVGWKSEILDNVSNAVVYVLIIVVAQFKSLIQFARFRVSGMRYIAVPRTKLFIDTDDYANCSCSTQLVYLAHFSPQVPLLTVFEDL